MPPVTRQLSTHPGVGPLTALAFELVIGTPERFGCAKQIASYVGLVPSEESSGDQGRLGHISKQGNVLLRFLLVEAAQVTVRSDPQWRSQFFHLAMRCGRKIAKVGDGPQTGNRLVLDVAARLGRFFDNGCMVSALPTLRAAIPGAQIFCSWEQNAYRESTPPNF